MRTGIRAILTFLAGSTACMAPAVMAPAALAQDSDLAARFGARPTVLSMTLSPSGDKIAFVSPGGALEEMVYVIDLNAGGEIRPVALDTNDNGYINGCSWGSQAYLVCNFRGTEEYGRYRIGFSRMLVVAADGSGVRQVESSRYRSISFNQNGGSVMLLDVPGKPDSILMQKITNAQSRIGSLIGNEEGGVGVVELDLESLNTSPVMRPRLESVGYLADETAQVRIMGTISRGSRGRIYDDDIEFSYVPQGESSFQSLVPDRELEDLGYVGIDNDANIAYLTGEADGFRSLYSIALDGSGKTQELLSRDGYDIDGVLTLGRSNRVIGATFATERRQFEYFDPDMRSLADELSQALPGNPLIEVVGSSSDEQRLLIFAHSDNDPGVVYLLDRSTNRMDQVLPLRRELEGVELAQVQPVTYAARDGVGIPGYLTLPPGSDGKGLPAIVMPHGGPGSRDEWGFDWLSQFFAASGYAVLQPNFRGSTGYGTQWELENGFQSWPTAIADVSDGARWMVDQGIADADKLAVVGWSYGGFAALQAAAVESDLFNAVVAIAPVTDLGVLRDDMRSSVNYPVLSEFLGRGEHIASGSPARRAEEISAPVMLVHGELDEPVPLRHSEIMEDALRDAGKQVEFLKFENLGHSLWDSQARTRMLQQAESFLERSLRLGNQELAGDTGPTGNAQVSLAD